MSKKSAAFNPKQLPLKNTTLARQVTRQNLTTLNDALWVAEHSHAIAKTSFNAITFPSGPRAHGCYGTNAQWSAAVDSNRLWVRQQVLVSAAALLEVYVASAISAALSACPEYADRSLAGTKEIVLIKFPERVPWFEKLIRKNVRTILFGSWTERLRQMATVFGKLPTKLESLAPALQGLQDRRNLIAHAFGRNTKEYRRTPWEPTESIKVEVADVEDALTCVSSAIREADLGLFAPLIGGYELLHEYHVWFTSFDDPFNRPAAGTRHVHFGKHIATKFGHGPSKEYYRSLIRYYDLCN